jgi:probable rRNA maturation factor
MVTLLVDQSYTQQMDRNALEHAAQKTLLEQAKSQDTDMTIVITSNEKVQELNRSFLGIDAPTDVLAFSAGYIDPDTERTYLGDIVIALPQADNQAQAAGHTLGEELQLLVVHGVLHLLGFDHDDPQVKQQMWAAQDKILKELNVSFQSPA